MGTARRYDVTCVKFNVREIFAIILDVTSYVSCVLVILGVHSKEIPTANASAAED